MSPLAREVLELALALDEADRATVAGALIESLEAPAESGVEQAWSEVISGESRSSSRATSRPLPGPRCASGCSVASSELE